MTRQTGDKVNKLLEDITKYAKTLKDTGLLQIEPAYGQVQWNPTPSMRTSSIESNPEEGTCIEDLLQIVNSEDLRYILRKFSSNLYLVCGTNYRGSDYTIELKPDGIYKTDFDWDNWDTGGITHFPDPIDCVTLKSIFSTLKINRRYINELKKYTIEHLKRINNVQRWIMRKGGTIQKDDIGNYVRWVQKY